MKKSIFVASPAFFCEKFRSCTSLRQALVGAMAVSLCSGFGASVVHAQLPTTNLLTNAGAESGDVTGWTVGGTSNPSVDTGVFDAGINPHSGNFDFYGGNGISGTLTQTVSLVGNQGITTALIDTGHLQAGVSFWEQGLNQGEPSDNAQITLNFFNGSATSIGTASTDIVDSHTNAWANFTGSYAIPVGTRTISYTMNFLRNQGSDNDSFVDDNSLIVKNSAAAPEPGSIVLSSLGMVGIAGGVLRRRRFLASL